MIGVAISTTGDRLGFLETCVHHWRMALPLGSYIVITVDGNAEAAKQARAAVDKSQSGGHIGGTTWRVGQRPRDRVPYPVLMGVAANKNTGLELMMNAGVEHLFLCDDDTYPLQSVGKYALRKHIGLAGWLPHSMVCWGQSRLHTKQTFYATWSWPRGVLLYTTRSVVDQVGGMVEAFGMGGHEHVEWSRRIHQHGLTPAPYCSPLLYAEQGTAGPATRAGSMWHLEDMRQPGETGVQLGRRRKRITSVRRTPEDWPHIERIMARMDGDTTFVPFRAHQNGRASATLC